MVSRWLYLGFVGVLALERLGELLLSRRNARRAFAAGGAETGRAHFRVMAAMHTAFLVACPAEVFLFDRAFPGVLGWACLAGALGSQALRYWAIFTLGERWNVRIITWPGRAPVTNGPYQFLRHPNYLAVCLEMIFVPLIHGAWLSAIVFSVANALVLRIRIREEEAALGAHYAAAFGVRA